jgi:hypothetical protein
LKRSDLINHSVDIFFDFLSSVVGNFSSNIVPLLAGILPAYLTWKHIVEVLNFPSWVGLAGAGVIEFIGLGAGNELMKVWNHNRSYKDERNKMPMLAPFLTAFWYIAIMIAFNVILEARPESLFWKIVSVALFATLAVPSYALIAGKTLRMEWKAERTQARAERIAVRQRTNSERTANRGERTNERQRTNEQFAVRQRIQEFVEGVRANEQRTPGVSEVSRALGVSKGYASETLQAILRGDEDG